MSNFQWQAAIYPTKQPMQQQAVFPPIDCISSNWLTRVKKSSISTETDLWSWYSANCSLALTWLRWPGRWAPAKTSREHECDKWNRCLFQLVAAPNRLSSETPHTRIRQCSFHHAFQPDSDIPVRPITATDSDNGGVPMSGSNPTIWQGMHIFRKF